MKFVLATHNPGKLKEMADILSGLGVEVVSPADVGISVDVEETGTTFAENAMLKAKAICAASGLPAIADDSGITVDVLGGAPGIFSARWAGSHGDDAANLRLLVDQLSDVPDTHRDAAFVSAAVLVTPDGREFVKRGEVRGTLTRSPRGEGGFGYDPIFVPEGFEVTTAQMSAEEKNAISHRGIAFRALMPHIVEYLRG